MTEMRLGDNVELQLKSTNIEQDTDFYEEIGFQLIPGQHTVHPCETLTDGSINFTISTEADDVPSIVYYNANLSHIAETLKYYEMSYQNMDSSIKFMIVPGSNITCQSQSTHFKHTPLQYTLSSLGRFGEYVIKSENYKTTKRLLTILGFQELYESEKQDWCIYTDQIISIRIESRPDIPNFMASFYTRNLSQAVKEFQERQYDVQPLSTDNKSYILTFPNKHKCLLMDSTQIY